MAIHHVLYSTVDYPLYFNCSADKIGVDMLRRPLFDIKSNFANSPLLNNAVMKLQRLGIMQKNEPSVLFNLVKVIFFVTDYYGKGDSLLFYRFMEPAQYRFIRRAFL